MKYFRTQRKFFSKRLYFLCLKLRHTASKLQNDEPKSRDHALERSVFPASVTGVAVTTIREIILTSVLYLST
jgi:hypothetical protein